MTSPLVPAVERQAEEAVPSGQEGLRLDGAGRAGHTQPLTAELRCHTAGWFEEPQLEKRPPQLQPPTESMFNWHFEPSKELNFTMTGNRAHLQTKPEVVLL